MTVAAWLASSEPDEMLVFLQGRASDRKLRLFCCACVRRIWYRLAHEASGHAVEVAEKFADGQKTQMELAAASLEADRAIQAAQDSKTKNALRAVAWCVSGEIDALSIARSVAWGAAYASQDATDAERSAQVLLLRDVFGNPFRPITLHPQLFTTTVTTLASQIYESRDFEAMPMLADALEQAGFSDAEILTHCRGPSPHVRGCWLVDLILGKN